MTQKKTIGVDCKHYDDNGCCDKLARHMFMKRSCTIFLNPNYKCNIQEKRPVWSSNNKAVQPTTRTTGTTTTTVARPVYAEKPLVEKTPTANKPWWLHDKEPEPKFCPGCKHHPKKEDEKGNEE